MDKSSYSFAPKCLVAALVCSAIAPAAGAQESTDGASAAAIVEPLQITKTADLDFGTLVPNGTGFGRVRIHARTGARRTNANVTAMGTDGFQRAQFELTGQPRTMISLTTSSPVITLTGPGVAMRMDRMKVNRNNGGQRNLPQTFRLGRTGTINIGFGGRLRVASDQAPGKYSGTFDLIATYQ
ncbi:MAG: DUF4402 domain-containing protein [Pontixanthobacter sp.]